MKFQHLGNMCVFFCKHLKQIKAIHHEFNHMMPVLFKANPMWTIWEGGKQKLSFGEFWTICWKKTIQFGLNVMLTTLERCAWFLAVVDYVCCIMCFVFGGGWKYVTIRPCVVQFAHIHHENLPNVGKYSIHGSYGNNQFILIEGPSENRSIAEFFLPKITPLTWQNIWPNHSKQTCHIICDMSIRICLYRFKS